MSHLHSGILLKYIQSLRFRHSSVNSYGNLHTSRTLTHQQIAHFSEWGGRGLTGLGKPGHHSDLTFGDDDLADQRNESKLCCCSRVLVA